MEQIVLKPASTKADIQNIAALGEEIWREHYAELLGEAQVAYMLDKFQSAPAVFAQLESGGYTYWLIFDGETPCGYCGFVKEPDRLFLSKLYLRRESRGKGLQAGCWKPSGRKRMGLAPSISQSTRKTAVRLPYTAILASGRLTLSKPISAADFIWMTTSWNCRLPAERRKL